MIFETKEKNHYLENNVNKELLLEYCMLKKIGKYI